MKGRYNNMYLLLRLHLKLQPSVHLVEGAVHGCGRLQGSGHGGDDRVLLLPVVHLGKVGDVRHRRPVHLDLPVVRGRRRRRHGDGLVVVLIQQHRRRRRRNARDAAVHLSDWRRRRLQRLGMGAPGQSHDHRRRRLGLLHEVACRRRRPQNLRHHRGRVADGHGCRGRRLRRELFHHSRLHRKRGNLHHLRRVRQRLKQGEKERNALAPGDLNAEWRCMFYVGQAPRTISKFWNIVVRLYLYLRVFKGYLCVFQVAQYRISTMSHLNHTECN